MTTRRQIEEYWNGRQDPPNEIDWQIHLMELKANRQLNRILKPGRRLKIEAIWSPTMQGPYPGKDPDPMDRFWVYVKGVYDLHKGQVGYDYASRLTVAALKQLPSNFQIPQKPNWWLYPGD